MAFQEKVTKEWSAFDGDYEKCMQDIKTKRRQNINRPLA
jgi:hypothetical protein